jgi:cyanophycin synthetase
MIEIKRSRAYFGRSLHSEGAAGYLCLNLDLGGEACDADRGFAALIRIRRMFSWSENDLEVGEVAARLSASERDSPENRLGLVTATTLEWVLRTVGETAPTIRWRAPAGDCDMELLIGCGDAEAGRRAGEYAVRLLDLVLTAGEGSAAFREQKGELMAGIEALRVFAADRRASATGAAIIGAAKERGIPVVELDRWPFVDENATFPAARRDLQLGWGIHGVRLRGTATDKVPAETYATLNDRHAAYDRLRSAGLPVPYRDPELRTINRTSRAIRVATRIGFPVVLKPAYRDAGLKPSGTLSGEPEVAAAYARLAEAGARQVMVERYTPGHRHRLLVIGHEVVAARRLSASSPELSLESSGEAEQRIDPGRLCPAVKTAAVSASRCFGLPLAAVEMITADPSASLEDSEGVLTDVDPSPDLADYSIEGERMPMTAARRVLAELFSAEATGRIPICAITGTNGKTTTSRMVASILQRAGRRIGLACTDGVYIQGERRQEGTFSGISGALTVFMDRGVDFAVLETSRGTLARRGLAFDHCEAAGCTNIASDHLDEEGIETLEQMSELKRLVVASARGCAVLNAGDPRCMAMLPFVNAKHVYLVSRADASDQIDAHLASGGLAVTLQPAADGQCITLRTTAGDTPIVETDRIPATFRSSAGHNIENAMFASALTYGLGVPIPIIRAALEGFSASIDDTPGRMNLYERLPFEVILDYAHNAHGMEALCRFIEGLAISGRRHIVVYWTRNTPRQADLAEAMRIIAPRFDQFICRDAAGTARDSEGTTARQVSSALIDAGAPEEAVRVIPDFQEAIDSVLHEAEPGDLVVIITGSKAAEVWRQVDTFRQGLQAGQRRA